MVSHNYSYDEALARRASSLRRYSISAGRQRRPAAKQTQQESGANKLKKKSENGIKTSKQERMPFLEPNKSNKKRTPDALEFNFLRQEVAETE
jgi:hypothetical protein